MRYTEKGLEIKGEVSTRRRLLYQIHHSTSTSTSCSLRKTFHFCRPSTVRGRGDILNLELDPSGGSFVRTSPRGSSNLRRRPPKEGEIQITFRSFFLPLSLSLSLSLAFFAIFIWRAFGDKVREKRSLAPDRLENRDRRIFV